MQVHKIEILVIDFDELGPSGVIQVLEHTNYPNHCLSPQVKSIKTAHVDWDDDHPLNHRDTEDEAYRDLFPA